MPPTGGLLVTTIFLGCGCFELAQAVTFVALILHYFRSNAPAEGMHLRFMPFLLGTFKLQARTLY